MHKTVEAESSSIIGHYYMRERIIHLDETRVFHKSRHFTRAVTLVLAIGTSPFKATGFDNEPGQLVVSPSAAPLGTALRH